MVIDQFAAWIAAERLPLLPEAGGFARLRREGTWFREMRYMHAATDTAPGHSSLYTGVPPRESGILANELVDARGPIDGAAVSGSAPASEPTVPVGGAS